MNYRNHNIFLTSFIILFFFLLSACSGDPEKTSTPKLTGTVATGKAGVGNLYIRDATGTDQNLVLTSSDQGKYSIDVSGMTPPFIIGFDQDPPDGVNDLFSFAEAANTTANVTELTTLTLFLANNQADLVSLFDGWKATPLSQSKIDVAQAIVNANLAAKIDAIDGLDSSTYDFMTTDFAPDQTGIDALLETITLDLTSNNLSFSIAGDSGFNFNNAIDASGINIGGTPSGTNGGTNVDDSNNNGTSGSGSKGDSSSGTFVFSNAAGLNVIVDDTKTTFRPDLQNLSDFTLSPTGSHIALYNYKNTTFEIITSSDGVATASETGLKPIGWINETTVLVAHHVKNAIYKLSTMKTDGTLTEVTTLDTNSDTQKACAASEYSLSPNKDKVVMVCGGFFNGNLIIVTLSDGNIVEHDVDVRLPALWLANDYIAWRVNDIKLGFAPSSDLSSPTIVDIAIKTLTPWGNAAVMVTSKDSDNVNSYISVAVPTGSQSDITWITSLETSGRYPRQIMASRDGTTAYFIEPPASFYSNGELSQVDINDGSNESLIGGGSGNIQTYRF